MCKVRHLNTIQRVVTVTVNTDTLCSVANYCVHVLYITVILLLLFHYNVIVNCSDIDCIFMYVAGIISMNYDDNESSATHPHMCSHWVLTLSLANRCKFTTNL